jgi:outer membrane protein OmpA-like peptidoglycan-associated protein
MVKIGGYTDSTGDAQLNYKLSDERAHTAMLALARRGVNPIRLQAKGYGPRYFVMPNNTAANRSLNRRVSIRVVKK